MQKVRNKWNGRLYTVKEETEKEVTLVRDDDTQITIAKSELHFNYTEYFDKNDKKLLTK